MIRPLAAALLSSLTLFGPAAQASGTATATHRDGRTVVDAPTTRVVSTPERTRVRVDAGGARVRVDTATRQVRIRVPGFSGDFSW